MLVAAALMTGFLTVSTLLPFLPVSHGIVRIGDFPRQQIASTAVVLAIAIALFLPLDWPAIVMVGLLVAVLGVQLWHILPFTPLGRPQSAPFDPAVDRGEALRLLACNVKMSNRRYGDLLGLVRVEKPDILVLMEIDRDWADALAPVLDSYADVVLRPQENSYGMVVASRFPLSEISVDCLLTDDVPSVIATARVASGLSFRLYAIHPEPPVPHRGTVGRDGETALVALKVKEERLPVLVTGDLNDVAWSLTTDRFRRISGLLDPRLGRMIFSTFDARYWPIRWPLDHLFHSPDFRLVSMRRLPPCGSDHFPVLFDLVLCRTEEAVTEPDEANGEDVETARDLVRDARKRDETPIGTDWEN